MSYLIVVFLFDYYCWLVLSHIGCGESYLFFVGLYEAETTIIFFS